MTRLLTVGQQARRSLTGRRNFATDTDGLNRIVLAGGYAPTDPTDSMESFLTVPSVRVGSITPTPTPTVSQRRQRRQRRQHQQ